MKLLIKNNTDISTALRYFTENEIQQICKYNIDGHVGYGKDKHILACWGSSRAS